MQEQNEWIPYTELDWLDEKFNVFNIDTRDFHAGYVFIEKGHKDILTLNKYPDFFHTKEEVVAYLDRYYKDSGGEKEWRQLLLENYGYDWSLKYLRIWRNSDNKFIICDRTNRALRKEILDKPIEDPLKK